MCMYVCACMPHVWGCLLRTGEALGALELRFLAVVNLLV